MKTLRLATALFLLVFGGLLFATAPSIAGGSNDLTGFLDRAEQMGTPNRPVRADITVGGTSPDKSKLVLILDPASKRQLLYVVADGSRTTGPLTWPGGAENEKLDAKIAGTDLRMMEWFPFWKTDYSKAFISDENRTEKTVSLYMADDIPYELVVVSFDKTKLVPTLVKYFQGSFSNMVRIRTDSDHVMVAARPRPTKIRVQDYTENTTVEYTLAWTELEEAPANLETWKPE
ncbi:MAG: hypothetical protein ACI8TX_000185 [Hyphomicrobiaceae bacterium]|jgi:hypothetical protein